MTSNYASILASKYRDHSDTSMQGEVELAFVVVEILGQVQEPTEPWQKLLTSARGLIKTRAKRSRTKFRMQYKRALESSDLDNPVELPDQELPKDREEKFKLRILNPQFMRVKSAGIVSQQDIAPKKQEVIISEDKPFTKEREDEFTRRINNPRSFRRSN